MKINITEMMRIKENLGNINNEMESIFIGINQEFGSITDNINSTVLQESIVNIQDNISSLGNSFAHNMMLLENFVNDQLSSYISSNEDAGNALKKLIVMINNTFDNEGGVIVSSSTTSLSDKSSIDTSSDNSSTIK